MKLSPGFLEFTNSEVICQCRDLFLGISFSESFLSRDHQVNFRGETIDKELLHEA